MTHVVGAALICGLVYCLTLGSADPIDFGTGALIGGLLVWLLRARLRAPTGPKPPLYRRVAWFPVFVGAVVVDATIGTWDVALRVLHLRPIDDQGFVWVPIGDRTERGLAVSTLVLTLSPGAMLIDVDRDRGEMLFHVIDASDPEDVRRRQRNFYDRYQSRVFP